VALEEYRKIVLTFWTDPDVKRPLTRDQKLLLLYFFTSPHSNMIGVYYCPLAYAANETGIPIDEVRAYVLGALARFLTYDEQTEEVFVHGLAKINVGDTLKVGKDGPDNRIKNVAKLVEAIHSTRLARAFLVRYAEVYHLNVSLPDDRTPPLQAPSEPLASPSEAIAVHSSTEQNSTSPTETGVARQQEASPGVDRAQLIGALRKICGPRQGKISDAAMRTNASCVDLLAGGKRKWSYADIHQAAAGTRTLIDRGAIPSIPAGTEWTLRVLTDATPDVDPMQRGLDAFRAQPPPAPTEKRGGAATGIADVLDFSKFAKGA
jgi:hypothetical protein